MRSRHSALNTFGRSSNPAFTKGFEDNVGDLPLSERMTLDGTVNKTGILLSLCFGGAFIGWNNPGLVMPALLIGFVLAMVTIFRSKEKAGTTAPLYALVQGVALGGITLMYENMFDGIAIQAIGLTFGILASLLLCYKSGLIKPTENFRLMIGAGIGGIFILYMVSFIMSFFGGGLSLLSPTNGSLMSIGLSFGIVCFASLSLVLDFDFIEDGAEKGLPKYMEWYGAFSLMVTLIWLYLEILRLLSKMRSR